MLPAAFLTAAFRWRCWALGALGRGHNYRRDRRRAGTVGAQNCNNGIAPKFYPTEIRATGIGWALAVGRIGSIIGPAVGGLLLATGPDAIFVFAMVPPLVAAAAYLVMGNPRLLQPRRLAFSAEIMLSARLLHCGNGFSLLTRWIEPGFVRALLLGLSRWICRRNRVFTTRATSMTPAASASSPTSRARKSHDIIRQGLQILVNLDHRGAVGADPLVGDGAGCLIQIPDALLRDWAREQRRRPAAARRLRRGDVLPAAGRGGARRRVTAARALHRGREARSCSAGATCRPTRPASARRCSSAMPVIRQAIVAPRRPTADQDAFERKLLAIRKQTQNPLAELAEEARAAGARRSSTCRRFSTRTVVYKGLLLATQVGSFYDDLRDPLTESALGAGAPALLDQHLPVSWKLAHPYRFIAHNGEINTVRGNVNWMNARRRTMESRSARRRPRQDVAADPARPVGHRLPRQRARAAGRRRLLARRTR